MNFLLQGVSIGRWFGIRVVLSYFFLLFAAFRIFSGNAAVPIAVNALFVGLLFAVVLLHEFGHALACKAVGGQAPLIVLWPLGGLAFAQPPDRPWPHFVTTLCGPLVNALLWPAFWFINRTWIYPQVDAGLGGYLHYACILMEEINRGLLLFNLIPAYPMDGGRLLQEILWFFVGFRRSSLIAGMIGTVAGVGFIVLGLGLRKIEIPYIDFSLGGEPSYPLVFIGFMCATESFALYRRAQEIQEWRKR